MRRWERVPWRRQWLAALIDGALLAPLLALRRRPRLLTVVGGVYEIGAVARWGGTVGQRAAGIRVVDYRSGGRTTLRQAVVRWAVPVGIGAAAKAIAPETPVDQAAMEQAMEREDFEALKALAPSRSVTARMVLSMLGPIVVPLVLRLLDADRRWLPEIVSGTVLVSR